MTTARQRQKAGNFPQRAGKREAGLFANFVKQSQTVLYDFSLDGGAVSTLSFGVKLPANAVITNVYSDEQTNLTSGGAATLQLKAGSTNLTDAEAYTAYAGTQSRALASSATAIKLSADSALSLAIAGAALTAGKVRFAVEYYISK